MKVKYLYQKALTQKQFFLLMVAPVLIGLFITLSSCAHAEWNQKDDPLLFQSPKQQGWKLMWTQNLSSTLLKSEKEAFKRASR